MKTTCLFCLAIGYTILFSGLGLMATERSPDTASVLSNVRNALQMDELASGSDWLLAFANHSEVGAITIFADGSGRVSQRFSGPGGPETVGFDGQDAWSEKESRARFRVPAAESASTTLGLWLWAGTWLVDGLPIAFGEARRVRQDIVVPIRYGDIAGNIHIDAERWLPHTVMWESEGLQSSAELSRWTSADGVRVPQRIALTTGPAKTSIEIQAVRRFDDVDPGSFLPDYVAYADTTFDGDHGPDLEVQRAPTGHILVQGQIGGHDPGWFIFDTGASVNTLATSVAERVGAKAVRETSLQGPSGSARGHVWQVESLRVGPVTLDQPILPGTDLSFLEEHFGVPVSGIIGTPTLARVVAEVDLSTPRIAFYEPRSYSRDGVEWETLILSSSMPALPARFEEHDGLFIVDIGSARTGIFFRKATDRLGLLEGRETGTAGGRGVGGANTMLAATLDWFELAGRRYESVEFFFSRATAGFWAESEATGNLGQELLHDFVLILDYPRQRFSMIPHKPVRQAELSSGVPSN